MLAFLNGERGTMVILGDEGGNLGDAKSTSLILIGSKTNFQY
jgi:hypothetical protein